MRMISLAMRVLVLGLLAWSALLPAPARAAGEKVGINAAVNTDANGTPPGGITKRLVIGEDVVHNEQITTDTNGQTQVLFVDGSSVSIGPDADLTIDDFVFDPSSGTGKMTLTTLQGAMRFVGGKLSKEDNAVTVHAGVATIGVRGGVFFADTQKTGSQVIFAYGKKLTVTGTNGSQELYRPGFAVDISPAGVVSAPHPAPPLATNAILAQIDGRRGANGGATTVPTNATVANSPVPNTVSNNIVASVQQAAIATATTTTPPPPPTAQPPQVPQNQVQTTSSQTQPVVTMTQTTQSTQPTQPTQPSGGVSGGINVLGNANPAFGFPNQIIGYSGATVQNGVLVVTIGSQSASIPLAQGTATISGTGTYSPVGALSGTTFSEPGDTFFYANLTPVSNPSNTIFAYGGTPVNPSAYNATGSPQFLAFTLEPDAVLNSQIPFIRNQTGGSLANASVSPLYIAVSPTTGFGTGTDSGSAFPKALQASLAFSGQGANQSSVIVVAVGNAFSAMANPNQTTAQPVLNGIAEGSYQPNATSPSTLINTAFLSAADSTGNAFYGGNTISGFVLDSNNCCGPNQIVSSATETNTLTGATTNYNFNIPAVATNLPAVGSGTQTTQTLTGFSGGIMNAITNGVSTPYAILGGSEIETDATNLQIAAFITGSDPFTQSTSGVNALVLSYGSLSPGDTNARQGYINDNLFGVLESPGGTGSSLNGTAGTAQLYLVNANAVATAINSILPAGVTPCSCQYVQWGYWGGELTTTTADGATRNDVGAINTWVAGVPTVTLPTVGSGSYSGAAIGTVYNAGATYVAAGGFGLSYNFGNNTGSISLSNFDGQNYTGTVSGGSGTAAYAGAIAGGSNRQGVVNGSFYGPGAAETGGGFAIQGTSGPSYLASGVFTGKLTGAIH